MGTGEIISAREAAGQLGVSREFVARLIREGRLSGRKIGRSWALDADEVRVQAELRGTRREVALK